MSNTITNYDGSIVTQPQQFVRPASVVDIQAVMREPDRYPGPVRAMGSFHSLTPCASSTGTIVSLLGMKADPLVGSSSEVGDCLASRRPQPPPASHHRRARHL